METGDAGKLMTVEPLVRRLLAPNAGPMTGPGTNSFIVGHGEVAIIDPGPDDPHHIDALLGAVAGERVTAILCTHSHRDHSPAAAPLAAATGAAIVGCAPLIVESDDPRIDAAFDRAYAPDRVLSDGERVAGPGWKLAAVATPGHASNHLCFALEETGALFSGDHVMGWSTTIVAPPDGNMTDYLASLERLLGREDRIYHPAHGDPIETPRRVVRSMLGHRRAREGQIVRLLGDGPSDVAALVARMYVGLDSRLLPAAALSVSAHLEDLERRGRVVGAGGTWRPTS